MHDSYIASGRDEGAVNIFTSHNSFEEEERD